MNKFRINLHGLGVALLCVALPFGYASSSSHGKAIGATMIQGGPGSVGQLAGGLSPTSSGVNQSTQSSGPIVVNWNITESHAKPKVINGITYEPVQKKANVNLTVNQDGSWNFSGSFPANPNRDIDVVVGLKSSEGTIVLFRYAGSLVNGGQWNQTGSNQTLKDNFKAFSPAHWYANYRQPLSAEGIAKLYADKEANKKAMAAAQKAEAEAQEKAEVAAEAARQKSNSNTSSNGGSSVMGDVANVLTGGLSSLGSAILSIF